MRSSTKIALFIFGSILISISYFTARHEPVLLMSQFTVVFGIYVYLSAQKEQFSVREITALAIMLRILLLFMAPNLSDDVYRFIWDGKMWLNGLNSYSMLPVEALQLGLPGLSKELFNKLNSPEYYTIYPPANQLIFYVSALFKNTTLSIVIIRLFVLAAEIGTIIILPKVLTHFNQSPKALIWYAFNPLIILELTANLHFEAFVIFFCMLALLYFKRQKLTKSAAALGMAVAFKIIPIILLAAVFKKIPFQKWLKYCLITSLVTIISFLPILFSDAISGFQQSSGLYFKNFEFNASIYYLARTLGFWWKGYNVIAFTGPLMGFLSLAAILIYNIFVKRSVSLAEKFMWSWFLYCLFATTLHPWYCLPLLAFGLLADYKFPVLWTFLIFFTYIGYTENGFQENLWVTFTEYLLLLIFMTWETVTKKELPNKSET